ncbi:MAG: copper chaperone PCu(A)C, partial [Pseudomonadota bacterium]
TGDVQIDDPWLRAAPPGAGMTAGYLTLRNDSGAPLTLVGASSDGHGEVSLHETRVDNGTSRMLGLDTVALPPGASVPFEPGGKHLMLMSPARDFAVGDTVRLTLHFADRDDLTVEATVRRSP